MKVFRTFSTAIFLILSEMILAQTNPAKEIQAETKKLETAIDKNNPKAEADSYMTLGDQYFNQNNFSKSEEFYQKAKTVYEKIDDKQNLADVTRKLAQSQERQKKFSKAKVSYEEASEVGYSSKSKKINTNDAERLSSNSARSKEIAVQSNIAVNSRQKNTDELSQDYENLANINVEKGEIPKAVENLNTAYKISKEEAPKRALELNQQVADLYVQNKDYQKAIEVKKAVLEEDFVKKNSEEKVAQIQQLADIYLKTDDRAEAIKLYQNAYELAISKNHTLEARKSLLKLDSLYNSEGNHGKSIELYQNFLTKLPTLLDEDQSLVDSKIIKETEERIAQLEKEKSLNEQLIKRKNLFNYLLIAGLVLAVGFIAFALYIQKKLRIQNKKIELQSLRREMNPHFIFNSLNSVNQFIAENNELEANQYLTRFSKLMRGVMENSKEDFIPFQEEFDLLNSYLMLEKSRFHDKFDYEISVAGDIDSSMEIPGMLIQPFLENAIWHGLRYKNEKGFLKLDFKKSENQFIITIEDNGIGIENSKAQKTEHQKQRNGRGMKNTLERIRLLNDLYGKNIICEVTDKNREEGVLVVLKMNI